MEERWKQHLKLARVQFRSNVKTVKFWNALRKYGPEKWEHLILENCDSFEDAKRLEIKWISEKNSYYFGYNSTLGGDGPMVGRKHTKEAKEKIRLAGIGRILSQETRKKIGNANRGKKHSLEQNNQTSLAKKGTKHSEQTKLKMSLKQKELWALRKEKSNVE